MLEITDITVKNNEITVNDNNQRILSKHESGIIYFSIEFSDIDYKVISDIPDDRSKEITEYAYLYEIKEGESFKLFIQDTIVVEVKRIDGKNQIIMNKKKENNILKKIKKYIDDF